MLLLGLGISGSTLGALSDILYAAAFVLPTALGLYLGKRHGAHLKTPRISRKDMALFLPVIFPAMLIIIAISELTSLLLTAVGFENAVTVYPTLLENIVRHALIPAVFEEALFRYLPVSLYGGENTRGCVLVSSLTFAFIHCNLFQIPYAFVAGVIFVSLNIMFDSPLPSWILHAVNNTVSVISLYYRTEGWVLISVSVLALLSSVILVMKRKYYIDETKDVFLTKSKLELSNSLLLIVIPTLIVAILNLFG